MAKSSIPKKHLIVDGYNIIHAWPDLNNALQHHGWESATTRLTDSLAVIFDVEDTRLTIVYDGNGPNISVDHPTNDPNLANLYTPDGIPADTIIQRLVANARQAKQVSVATNDIPLLQAITDLGATPLSSDALWELLKTCEQRQNRNINTLRQNTNNSWKLNNPFNDLPK